MSRNADVGYEDRVLNIEEFKLEPTDADFEDGIEDIGPIGADQESQDIGKKRKGIDEEKVFRSLCDKCELSFANSSSLNRHKNLNMKESIILVINVSSLLPIQLL